ncbi:MAG: sigma-70 family RNA polymerase sigma factor [Chryseolinea sp.]
MTDSIDSDFLKLINDNLGIAQKVTTIYFDDLDTRQDVMQEMMYQLWKSFRTFDGRSKFSTWMYSVCLNTALTYHRKSRKDQSERLKAHHDNIADKSGGTDDEDMLFMFQAIAALSPLNKAIVLLYLEDMSYEEIATITGLTKTNVSVRLVRIKKELQLFMKKII